MQHNIHSMGPHGTVWAELNTEPATAANYDNAPTEIAPRNVTCVGAQHFF